MAFETTEDLRKDALWLVGEPTTGTSDYHDRALDLLNATYHTLVTSGTVGPHPVAARPWLWCRFGTLHRLEAAFNASQTFTISLTTNSNIATIAVAPSTSFATNYYLVLPEYGFQAGVSLHSAGDMQITLDTTWPNADLSNYTAWRIVRTKYPLANGFVRAIAPLLIDVPPYRIPIIDDPGFRVHYPLVGMSAGVPRVAALSGRYNAGVPVFVLDRWPESYLDARCAYIGTPPTLTTNQSPYIPVHERRVLSFGAALQLAIDKADPDKIARLGAMFNAALQGMARNYDRLVRDAGDYADLRLPAKVRLLTESGLEIESGYGE